MEPHLVRALDRTWQWTTPLYRHSPEDAKHSLGVGYLAERLAQTLGMPDIVVDEVATGGLLHDIGKIGIGSDLLAKEHASEQELAEMRTHPTYSRLLLNGNVPKDILYIVMNVHEDALRPYPREVPQKAPSKAAHLAAKIVSLSDQLHRAVYGTVWHGPVADEALFADLEAHYKPQDIREDDRIKLITYATKIATVRPIEQRMRHMRRLEEGVVKQWESMQVMGEQQLATFYNLITEHDERIAGERKEIHEEKTTLRRPPFRGVRELLIET